MLQAYYEWINTLQAFRKYFSVLSKFKMCLASNHDQIKLLTLGFAKCQSFAIAVRSVFRNTNECTGPQVGHLQHPHEEAFTTYTFIRAVWLVFSHCWSTYKIHILYILRSGTYNIHMEYCTCNDKPKCNIAPAALLNPALAALPLLFSSAYFWRLITTWKNLYIYYRVGKDIN